MGRESRKDSRADPFRVESFLQIDRQAAGRLVSVIFPEGAAVQNHNALIARVVVIDGGDPKGTLPPGGVEHHCVPHRLPVPERETLRNHRRILSDGCSHGRSPIPWGFEQQSRAVQLDREVA